MSFTFNWPRFSDQFHYDTIQMLNNALNKGNKPPIIADKIEVVELEMGTQPPELEIRDIGELTVDQFRGIFRLTYSGDAHLVLKTKVQANPLNHKQSEIHTMTGSKGMLAARQPLVVPMLLRLSHFRLDSYVVLVISKQKGITLVFKTDPLQNVDINSTFDSIAVIQKFIQREIEGQLRQMFREDLPGIIHRLSQQWIKAKVEAPYLQRPDSPFTAPRIERPLHISVPRPHSPVSVKSAHIPREIDDFPFAIQPPRRPRSTSGMSVASTSHVPRTPQSAHAHQQLQHAISPNADSSNPQETELLDLTYGLRPEGLPTKSAFRDFGNMFTQNKGLAGLAEEPTDEDAYADFDDDDNDDDVATSYGMVEWGDNMDSISPPSSISPPEKDEGTPAPEYETIPAVGGGTIMRPRIYHSHSLIQPGIPHPSYPPNLHSQRSNTAAAARTPTTFAGLYRSYSTSMFTPMPGFANPALGRPYNSHFGEQPGGKESTSGSGPASIPSAPPSSYDPNLTTPRNLSTLNQPQPKYPNQRYNPPPSPSPITPNSRGPHASHSNNHHHHRSTYSSEGEEGDEDDDASSLLEGSTLGLFMQPSQRGRRVTTAGRVPQSKRRSSVSPVSAGSEASAGHNLSMANQPASLHHPLASRLLHLSVPVPSQISHAHKHQPSPRTPPPPRTPHSPSGSGNTNTRLPLASSASFVPEDASAYTYTQTQHAYNRHGHHQNNSGDSSYPLHLNQYQHQHQHQPQLHKKTHSHTHSLASSSRSQNAEYGHYSQAPAPAPQHPYPSSSSHQAPPHLTHQHQPQFQPQPQPQSHSRSHSQHTHQISRSSSRHTHTPPTKNIVLRPNSPHSTSAIHQLQSLSQSNHTLSPFTRNLQHFTMRSVPPRRSTGSNGSPGGGGSRGGTGEPAPPGLGSGSGRSMSGGSEGDTRRAGTSARPLTVGRAGMGGWVPSRTLNAPMGAVRSRQLGAGGSGGGATGGMGGVKGRRKRIYHIGGGGGGGEPDTQDRGGTSGASDHAEDADDPFANTPPNPHSFRPQHLPPHAYRPRYQEYAPPHQQGPRLRRSRNLGDLAGPDDADIDVRDMERYFRAQRDHELDIDDHRPPPGPPPPLPFRRVSVSIPLGGLLPRAVTNIRAGAVSPAPPASPTSPALTHSSALGGASTRSASPGVPMMRTASGHGGGGGRKAASKQPSMQTLRPGEGAGPESRDMAGGGLRGGRA